MPLNIPGVLVPFQLLIQPRLVIPGVIVKDIRHIDFAALKRAGYRGAVFDKDNCLTIPHKDTLVPELQESWKECREIFGEGNVLITESVTHHLGVPVLQHKAFKPAYSCITAIRTYFSSLRSPILDHELIVTTATSRGPLAIWTTGVWKKESMLMRLLEGQLVKSVQKWSTPPAGEPFDSRQFVKEVAKPEPPRRQSLFDGLISRLRRA
ncbi:mitochondrial PGP phosphatase-domain-containing protein [Pholiota molesta]|nr:mitochondrial PGP phosphatase-domain-containing protein [Pholiota molesta]